MRLLVDPRGRVRCIYDEALELAALGRLAIARASFVEPDAHGRWAADLSPVGGPILGPFDRRVQALEAEVAWIERDWLASVGRAVFESVSARSDEYGYSFSRFGRRRNFPASTGAASGPKIHFLRRRPRSLNARTKLNLAYFNGCLLLAAVVGGACGSWLVFILAMAGFVACSVVAGNIRPRPSRR
ncbi:hypothetical protein [Paludisphaera rhizosphaerae]|uniref:hypothetical protein n=1 Tax=Paludisphaera rhizosphaerae TaxID=2711216 RepID=UPI00197D86DE|nr:hypothetical protein [Paludisphaera rhizosphaerae]